MKKWNKIKIWRGILFVGNEEHLSGAKQIIGEYEDMMGAYRELRSEVCGEYRAGDIQGYPLLCHEDIITLQDMHPCA